MACSHTFWPRGLRGSPSGSSNVARMTSLAIYPLLTVICDSQLWFSFPGVGWGGAEFSRKQIIKQHSMFAFGFERIYSNHKYWSDIKKVKGRKYEFPQTLHPVMNGLLCSSLFSSHIYTCKQITQVRHKPMCTCFICKDETLFCIWF